ncbi:MAG: hypothetical protein RLZ12_875 [Bacillota bacterium]|jgi:valyl-tRNA synthetase
MHIELPSIYRPATCEKKWGTFWEQEGLCSSDKKQGEAYTVLIPPPNVTGELHIGHALNNTIQDILVRFKRMQGFDVLWLPGKDHAGIATESKLLAKLKKEGINRHDLSREEFLKHAWGWKDDYAKAITKQWQRLGLSLDYSKERFTLDEGFQLAVREAFVRLYRQGYIYRGLRIINWDPKLGTALSDIEVIHRETKGKLYYLAYKLVDTHLQEHLEVATTRPETILGDTALAVNPKDKRYQHLIGAEVKVPLINRTIPIIADQYVDPEFGSGVVKITPAHDPNDFEVGERHQLQQIIVMDEHGQMNKNAGNYTGLSRAACREQIVADLELANYLLKTEDHIHAVGYSERSGAIVEPYLSLQWFVKMKPLAEEAKKVQTKKDGGIHFVPTRFEKTYLQWIDQIRDWCISRQIWWGHRIPAWHCANCNELTVELTTPERCPHCQCDTLQQEEDVLDTWFSSALWPMAVHGWPKETAALAKRYPSTCLVTGYDIIYFWVARMSFLGLEFMGEQPFTDVLLTGLIRDKHGQKMSKSLGNGVDPIELIEEYGTDALRFMLAAGCTPGNDQRFIRENIIAARSFANKLWNSARFCLLASAEQEHQNLSLPDTLSVSERWLLSKLNKTIKVSTTALDRYDFKLATHTIYNFIWHDFCDWYLEFAKVLLKTTQAPEVLAVLQYVLKNILQLLHPFMPFITEELWQHVAQSTKSIVLSNWPTNTQANHDIEAEHQMQVLMEIITEIRSLRADLNITPGQKLTIVIRAEPKIEHVLTKYQAVLERMTNALNLTVNSELTRPPHSVAIVVTEAELFVSLPDELNRDQLLLKLEEDLKRVQYELTRAKDKLSNQSFVTNAKEELVAAENQKLKEYSAKEKKINQRIKEVKLEC